MRSSERLDAAWALRRYEELRPRLPDARFPSRTREAATLADLVDEFDVFVLDGYGVLNIGTDPVPDAATRVAALKRMGKRIFVLTNGATYPARHTVQRYTHLGFDLVPDEVISSRSALDRAMERRRGVRWGFAATAESAIGELAPNGFRLGDDPEAFAAAEGFVLLSTGDWTPARHELMVGALTSRPRPVLVGNPDLVAPREDGLSPEPGLYAHDIADRTGIPPEFFGKPFANAFDLVRARVGPQVPPSRIAMVGDSPHTDILGGAAAGWRTVLVRGHGLVKDIARDVLWRVTDIRPDFIVAST